MLSWKARHLLLSDTQDQLRIGLVGTSLANFYLLKAKGRKKCLLEFFLELFLWEITRISLTRLLIRAATA